MFKVFIIRSVLFLSIMAAILTATAWAVDRGLRKSDHPNFKEWNEIADGAINADLIINGSSRARGHISPAILDSALGLNTFNLGLDGHQFDAEYMRYKFYRKYNEKPRVVVQTLDLLALTRKDAPFQPMQFAPYLGDSIIRNGTRIIQAFSEEDFLLPFAKYAFENNYIYSGLRELISPATYPPEAYKGYEPQDLVWNNSFDKMRKQYPGGLTINNHPETIRLFRNFLEECKAEEIFVVMVYTPEYRGLRPYVNGRERLIELYRKIADEHGIPFLNYSDHEMSSIRDYFYDSNHLHKRGAEMFSRILARDLKTLIDENRLRTSE